jgi:hypothetical protein
VAAGLPPATGPPTGGGGGACPPSQDGTGPGPRQRRTLGTSRDDPARSADDASRRDDRQAVDRGDGVFLAGDMVAAPGLLSEVAFNSALAASRAALRLTSHASRTA